MKSDESSEEDTTQLFPLPLETIENSAMGLKLKYLSQENKDLQAKLSNQKKQNVLLMDFREVLSNLAVIYNDSN